VGGAVTDMRKVENIPMIVQINIEDFVDAPKGKE
jgi:hypothetical protein